MFPFTGPSWVVRPLLLGLLVAGCLLAARSAALGAATAGGEGDTAPQAGISGASRLASPPAEGASERAADVTIRPANRRGRLSAPSDQEPAKTHWLSADQVQRLGTVSFTSSNTSLRQALGKISAGVRLAILLDRRIDSDQDVEFDVANMPLAEAVAQIAAKVHAGSTLVGPVAYIGPRETARDLRTLAALASEAAGRLPTRQKAAALASSPLRWSALVTPSEVLQILSDEAGVEIKGLDQIPHDLLAATDLPAMPWVDRLTLVAAQFGRKLEFDRGGRAVTLVPTGDQARLEAQLSRWPRSAGTSRALEKTGAGGRNHDFARADCGARAARGSGANLGTQSSSNR